MSYPEFLDYISAPDLGWTLLLIASVVDIVLPFFLGLFVRSFSHTYMAMSALGEPGSPVRPLYCRWLVCAGLMFLAACPQVYYAYMDVSVTLAMALAVCLAVYGIGACILAGVFPVGEGSRPETVGEWIHGIGSSSGFITLTLASLFLSILQFQGRQTSLGTVSIIGFAAACTFFVLFVLSDKDRFTGTPISWTGTWQRLTLLASYLPFMVTAANFADNL